MTKLTKYEKETILLSSEGDDYWELYTFNPTLKRRFAAYAKNHPDLCELKAITEEGSVTYRISKARLSIRLTEPYSEERRRASSERAKQSELMSKL
ncbi:hypothetical protein [Lachnoanaerobaculum sp. MSX33]|uniref:hypothetical protein n=1 Tax=Lachnoanaerobaculum sp. MSX33 TaxID=936596 RepID=UPI0005532248|nr:hypothetical protein [Lachnoanaerobaculum sp. MSX33]